MKIHFAHTILKHFGTSKRVSTFLAAFIVATILAVTVNVKSQEPAQQPVGTMAETDVTVSSGDLIVTDDNGGTTDDTLTISLNGANVRIIDPSHTLSAGAGAMQVDANTVDVPLGTISGNIQVNTLAGNDTLTLSLAGGDFIPAGGLSFAGGDPTTGPGDKLIVIGGSQGTVTYNYTNAHEGSIVMSSFGTVSYTGLEPITNSGTASDIVFNLPAGPNAATLGDDTSSGNGMSRLSGVTIETTDFTNPSGSLTINRGDAGDTLRVNALPEFNAHLTIGSQLNPFSTVDFRGAVTLAADKKLSADASGTINLSMSASDLAGTGTGSISLTTAKNISLASGSSLTTFSGPITLMANLQEPATTSSFSGISVSNATIQSTSGDITLQGRGGNGVSNGTSNQRGVYLLGGATVGGGTSGTVSVTGTGGAGPGVGNSGVEVDGLGSQVTSGGGNIFLTGQGGGIGNGGYLSRGVRVQNGGLVFVGGSGNLTIQGTGGGTGASRQNYGVDITNAGTQVLSEDGDIVIIGQGGGSGGNDVVGLNIGVIVDASQVKADGNGKITIDGTGGGGGDQNFGVFLLLSTVESVGGDVIVTGLGGGNGTSDRNVGVNLNGGSGSGVLSTGGMGTITVLGTGGVGNDGLNRGIVVVTDYGVQSANGDITMTGIEGAGASSFGFESITTTGAFVKTTGAGHITIIANSVKIDPGFSIDAGVNTVTLSQRAANVGFNLGTASDTMGGPVGLSDAELDLITAGTLQIGNSNSGAITVSAGITRPASTILNLTSGGAININASALDSGCGNVKLSPGAGTAVKPAASGPDVSMSTTGTLSFASDLGIAINGTTVDTQYQQLNVIGEIDLTGVDLLLSGTHVPFPAQTFTIVDNDGVDPVTGAFSGLPEGTFIPGFLGSPLGAKITYVGGDGNDVVLRVMVSPTAASARISGQIVTADGQPVSGATVTVLGAPGTIRTITDSNGFYRVENLEVGVFYTVTPGRANFVFAPVNRAFSLVGDKTDAVFTGAPINPDANPLESPEFFVRQQYLDFLGREPEQSGLDYWSGQLRACGQNVDCLNTRRLDISAAFFIAQEFQDSGLYIYDVYQGALGRRPDYAEYALGRMRVVGGPRLEADKTTFATSFVQREDFTAHYPLALTADAFVEALLGTAQQSSGIDLSSTRADLVTLYNTGASTTASRSLVLRSVAEGSRFRQTQYNPAFVLMEYYGYLGRNPDGEGYAFWLNVLNSGDGANYRGMVCSFITSAEYQRRFSPVVTRSNAECGRQ